MLFKQHLYALDLNPAEPVNIVRNCGTDERWKGVL